MKLLLSLAFLPAYLLAYTARETLPEAAIRTRELIAYRSYHIGTLISSFKEDTAPYDDLEGAPVGLQEYYAPFPSSEVGEEEDVGDLLLLAMPISKVFRNALPPYSSNLTMTVSDLYGLGTGNLAAGRMRIGLFGSLERVPESQIEACKEAYLRAHPDARGWIPPNGPHNAFYARFRVSRVYAFGGFGDVAYIGFIPPSLYISSAKLMRPENEVKKRWPEPIQPEGVFGWNTGLWDDNGVMGEAIMLNEDGERIQNQEKGREEREEEQRFRIQW